MQKTMAILVLRELRRNTVVNEYNISSVLYFQLQSGSAGIDTTSIACCNCFVVIFIVENT